MSIILVLMLVAGCDAHSRRAETKLDLQPPSGEPRSELESPGPRYGLPLTIQVDVPETPEDLRRPSPPIAPGTPMPGGMLNSLLKGSG